MGASTKFTFALVLAAGLAGAAQAQHPYLPEQNTKEVDFAAAFNFDPVDSQSIAARLGYFLNRNLQVGVDGAYSRVANGRTESIWSLGGFANWHFPGSTPLLPYVGGFVGYTDATGADSNAAFGAQGGAKYFFNQNVAGFAELRWRSIDDGSDQTGIFLGLSVFFK
jgi:outer membrane protease